MGRDAWLKEKRAVRVFKVRGPEGRGAPRTGGRERESEDVKGLQGDQDLLRDGEGWSG